MPRARNLKPSFFTDDEIAEQPPLGRLLFQALWCLSDREGRLDDKPKKIKAEALPYDNCNIDRLLKDLHDARFIVRYEHDGKRYIQIRQFKKHQNPHVKEHPSTIPAPDSSPAKHGAETGQDPENPERAGLIVDSGFPLIDSGLPDSGSPPPDPGLPPPASAAPTGPGNGSLQRALKAKPVEKEGRSKANGHNAQSADQTAVFELGKQLGILPKKDEIFAEYQLRVMQGGKTANKPGH